MLINVAFPVFMASKEWHNTFEKLNYDIEATKKAVGSPFVSNQHPDLKERDGVYYTPLNPDSGFKNAGLSVCSPYDSGVSQAYELWKYREEKGLPFMSLSEIIHMVRLARYGHAEHVEYGVCDNADQILVKWPHLQNSIQHHFITMTPIYRKNQSPTGGWRWHKWGAYIGEHEPQCEYLYDEEGIDVVYVFHIYTLQPNSGYGRENWKDIA